MKTILVITIFLLLSFSIKAQTQWTYDMYEKYDHTNFRNCKLFNQKFLKSNPDIALMNAALFYLTNEKRANDNIYLLDYHPACEIAAYNHSKSMVEDDFFSHENSINNKRNSTTQRAELAGISNPSIAENIAYNYTHSDDTYLTIANSLILNWMKSTGHRENILSKEAYQVGCGVYLKDNIIYATQVFQWFNRVLETTASDLLPKLKDGKQAVAKEVLFKK